MNVYIKSTLILCLLCLSIAACRSQVATTARQMNLKGPIRSVYTTDGTLFVRMTFDRQGRLTGKETMWLLYDNYEYDRRGRLLSYEIETKSSSRRTKEEPEYNGRGWMVYDTDSYYEYDRRGRCVVERQSYSSIGRAYDDRDRVVEEWVFTETEEVFNVWISDVGEDGIDRAYEVTEVIPPREYAHTFIEYNDSGDPLRRSTTSDEGVTRVDEISYLYDGHGNWTERTNTDPFTDYSVLGDVYGAKATRVIEYYE